MFPVKRAIRPSLRHHARRLPRPAVASQAQKLRLRRLHHPHRVLLTPPHYARSRTAQRSVIDPISFLVAVALSTGIAYVVTAYTSSHETTSTKDDKLEAEQDWSAPSAQEYGNNLVMAANMPPGRPGNLTADQTEKLKEMWAATLDVFGVANEPGAANGAATPSSETASLADPKQKKKKRLSLFKKKDKDAGSDASSTDNDKHGQNRDFQQALASQTPEELRAAFWSMSKHDHPDALLLRFLRARKWDVHAALIMMISTMHWRSAEMHVDDDIMLHGEALAFADSKSPSSNAAQKKEGEDFLAQLRLGKSFLHGTDKDGRPCCYVRVRLHKQGEQSEKALERFTVYQIETTRMLLRPPIDTATIVFDMTDFSMANMDYTPVKFMIKCFEANYPESLGSVLVYKSPWLFQGIWKIIKGWLDPVVASKVHFASNVEDLQQWIPKSRIMRELGGDEEYTYTYVEPRGESENEAMQDTATRDRMLAERRELVRSYEAETLAWVHGEEGGEGRTRLAQRLAENYWRVDPYVRARSLYDRMGMLGAGGRLDFYPPKAGHGAAAGGVGVAASAGHDDGVD
ncbi:hypothetical protein LTR36_006825 [Oleoguttula mirabilis]|uniref:CRAL-TRIO domain-containing protein n=1 Tax=Oleoguttula mirabilis TaxID=1507867 RepID=A0AAV9JC43_9PEZI|nr:hypothetical protein LTR36_006825 [Oleoguttula mirabilis]